MHSTSAWCRDVAVRDVTLSMLLLPVKPEMMKFMNFITVYIHRCRVIDHTHIYIYNDDDDDEDEDEDEDDDDDDITCVV